MKCPRCGKMIPPGASFCMYCGQQMSAKRMEMPAGAHPGYPVAPAYVPVPSQRQNRWLWPAIIAAFLVLAALGATAFLMAPAQKTSAPLAVQAKPAGPVPLVVGRPAMPQNVYDWLDHLRQTEDKKNALANDQEAKLTIELTKLEGLGGAYGALDDQNNLDPDKLQSPTERVQQQLGDLRQPWRDLIQYFESDPPPAECTDLAHTYDQALDEVSGEMGDLGDALSGPNGAPPDPQQLVAKLQSLQGQSAGTIDKYFSVSDDMVASLCNKYNTRKWFTIKADSGNPMAAGMGGLGGVPPQQLKPDDNVAP